MTVYSWPATGKDGDAGDDPGGRARFVSRRRLDFDREGALAAGRMAAASTTPPLTPTPRPSRGRRVVAAPMGQPGGRQHLWQALGPMTVVHGQAIGTPRIAGRVNALAVEPVNGERIYAASGNGGLWYSGDSGTTWSALGGFAPTVTADINRPIQRHSCGAVGVAFGATIDGDEVFVGTGEPWNINDAEPGSSLHGIGILVASGPGKLTSVNPFSREAKNLIGAAVSRFAMEPGGSTVVAATTIGLLQRPDPAGPDEDWQRVAGAPFKNLTDECTDVLWTAAAGATPERLWVWVRRGDSAGLWVRDAGTTDFVKIATPGALAKRAALGAATPPTTVYVFNDQGKTSLPALFRVASGAGKPVASFVFGVPDVLKKQGSYDIAIAVDPSNAKNVVLGGCTFDTVTADGTLLEDDGAIVLGDVDMAGAPAKLTFGATASTMIGVGVHSDVHDLKYAKNGARLYASCDGGVYRSNAPTRMVGFVSCNDGLSIVEADYIASHPTCEGFVVTGLQDNGVIARLSNGVWKNVGLGDGGGVVFDPLNPTRFVRQHFQAFWSASDGTFKAKAMLTRGAVFASDEFEAAAFYSQAASIAHHRTTVAPAAPDVGQIIIGTRRVWYTEDFGTTWVTLPTATDPLPGDLKFKQDDFGEQITVCRWQSPDVAWVLSEGKLMRYARTPGSDSGGGPGTWLPPATIIKKNVKNKKDATSADGPIRDSDVWTDIAVNLDPPPGANQLPAQHGTTGAMYLGTIGKPDDNDVDTLWWFDGTSKWFKTGLRTDPTGVPAPVTAIVCDPAFPEEVYVGTTVGVWKGIRTQIGNADPAWTWSSRLNGLPEAAVEDLTIFSDGGLRILRAAIAARGAWELRLDAADVVELTYVRAHDDDLRYRVRALGTKRDLKTARSWHASPDVRPRLAPLTVAPPTSLPWTKALFGDAEELRRFQASLRSKTGDARIRATGAWDDYFNEVLRDLGAPTLPSPPAAKAGIVSIDNAFWTANVVAPHSTREPWGTGTPSEADLYDLTAELTEGDLKRASSSLPAKAAKVEIVVHHRGLDTIAGTNVRVTLLKWIDPNKKKAAPWDDSTKWPTVDVPWTGAVNDVLNSAVGTTSKTFAGGWSFVGTTPTTQRVTLAGQTLDSTHSGIASFDLALTGLKRNTVVLLCAVIRTGTSSADDVALAPNALEELVLTNANVAVRSLRIFP